MTSVKRPLYVFNPEHDLALASGETNYMPPASARRMAADLALLPAWYADAGSLVLAPSAYHWDYLERMKGRLPVPACLLTEPELADAPLSEIRPWGWDAALRKRLAVAGVETGLLPTDAQLATLRTCSHRSLAVELLPRLQSAWCCGESCYLQTLEECRSFVEGHPSCLLKAPLSGSGKGLNWCKGVFTPFIAGWCSRVVAAQGGVVGEPIYNKVEDFAMEFQVDAAGNASFVGYSLFHTSSNGMYAGNSLLSDAVIRERLSAYVPVEVLVALEARLMQELGSVLAGRYVGLLGVDMMICRCVAADGSAVYRVHPCVEINLRMNMGLVARLFFNRYLCPDAEGLFRVDYCAGEGEALQKHTQMEEAFPLEAKEGRIVSGYLSLVPVHRRSLYRAWVQVGR